MKKFIVTMALALVSFGTSASETERENLEFYGEHCRVYDEVNVWTDQTSYVLKCGDCIWSNGGLYLIVSDMKVKSVVIHEDDGLFVTQSNAGQEVATRFDKKEIQKFEYSNDEWEINNGSNVFEYLLNELAISNRLVILINDETQNINLKGSSNAVVDFKQRIEHLNII